MNVVIQFTEPEEAKALPILLRHSPGAILPNRTYVVRPDAAKKLRDEGIQFRELSRDFDVPNLVGVGPLERI